jgi:hypothetical protein
MNANDRKRFARYYPNYIEPLELKEQELVDNNQNDKHSDKKNILGYINKINIDKNKLVIDTITHSNLQ